MVQVPVDGRGYVMMVDMQVVVVVVLMTVMWDVVKVVEVKMN